VLAVHRTGPDDFEREESLDQVGAKINRDMTWGADRALSGGGITPQEELTQKMWAAMEEVIIPAECSIYSYKPEGDMDPLSTEGKVSLPGSERPTFACCCDLALLPAPCSLFPGRGRWFLFFGPCCLLVLSDLRGFVLGRYLLQAR
jgi:hypothetical protein